MSSTVPHTGRIQSGIIVKVAQYTRAILSGLLQILMVHRLTPARPGPWQLASLPNLSPPTPSVTNGCHADPEQWALLSSLSKAAFLQRGRQVDCNFDFSKSSTDDTFLLIFEKSASSLSPSHCILLNSSRNLASTVKLPPMWDGLWSAVLPSQSLPPHAGIYGLPYGHH